MTANQKDISVSKRLYESVQEIWESYHQHSFVQGIGKGDLAMDRFRFYMLQDYLYLYDYAKVFALGVVKAKDPNLMRFFADNVDQILNGEMKIHQSYMNRLGITKDEVANARKSPANDSYTNYMLSIGFQGDVAEITAAILSCSWSYQEIGSRIVSAHPQSLTHDFYGEWVQGYTSKEYVDTNDALLVMMDSLARDYSEDQIQNLMTIFVNCSLYERMFWDMAWNMEY
ncbi:thiaminase II [Dehalobacterium formicoaceticum]|uniref:Aminopyrimidine aminohydrolase n=1 Tax=Dehalobacterium formicoaceticum TaxID=51515 RepID=A0ABT1XZP5_9FIRM|nr:thiaminase II [Dehalobacterium formicoaceticum]MCR6544086.1 thiaminase II [Dehalobacterium formicoaceticum]